MACGTSLHERAQVFSQALDSAIHVFNYLISAYILVRLNFVGLAIISIERVFMELSSFSWFKSFVWTIHARALQIFLYIHPNYHHCSAQDFFCEIRWSKLWMFWSIKTKVHSTHIPLIFLIFLQVPQQMNTNRHRITYLIFFLDFCLIRFKIAQNFNILLSIVFIKFFDYHFFFENWLQIFWSYLLEYYLALQDAFHQPTLLKVFFSTNHSCFS